MFFGETGTSIAKQLSGCSGQGTSSRQRPRCCCSPKKETAPATSPTCSACGMRLSAAGRTLPSSNMERYCSCPRVIPTAFSKIYLRVFQGERACLLQASLPACNVQSSPVYLPGNLFSGLQKVAGIGQKMYSIAECWHVCAMLPAFASCFNSRGFRGLLIASHHPPSFACCFSHQPNLDASLSSIPAST